MAFLPAVLAKSAFLKWLTPKAKLWFTNTFKNEVLSALEAMPGKAREVFNTIRFENQFEECLAASVCGDFKASGISQKAFNEMAADLAANFDLSAFDGRERYLEAIKHALSGINTSYLLGANNPQYSRLKAQAGGIMTEELLRLAADNKYTYMVVRSDEGQTSSIDKLFDSAYTEANKGTVYKRHNCLKDLLKNPNLGAMHRGDGHEFAVAIIGAEENPMSKQQILSAYCASDAEAVARYSNVNIGYTGKAFKAFAKCCEHGDSYAYFASRVFLDSKVLDVINTIGELLGENSVAQDTKINGAIMTKLADRKQIDTLRKDPDARSIIDALGKNSPGTKKLDAIIELSNLPVKALDRVLANARHVVSTMNSRPGDDDKLRALKEYCTTTTTAVRQEELDPPLAVHR